MDLTDPTRAVTPTLDGPILAVLAATGRALTVGEIANQAARGSEIGVRKSLARLVEQGIVKATLVGRNTVHELNRDHIAAPVADILANLRTELWERFRKELESWSPLPVYACIFGSAARRDGGPESDIDLLLVHPPFPGESPPTPKRKSGWIEVVGTFLSTFSVVPQTPANAQTWQKQVDRLRGEVRKWTGNTLQVVDLSYYEWMSPRDTTKPLFDEIAKVHVDLARSIPGINTPIKL
jgi:hypothetical protein